MMRSLAGVLAILAMILGMSGAPVGAAPVRTPHLTAELVGQTAGVAPGSTLYVAVVQTIDPGWHTYWRNPGDAGEATRLQWRLPAGWKAGDIVWPAPSRFLAGPLMNYGYSDRAILAVPIAAPSSASVGGTANLQVKVEFLVCSASLCVPETAQLDLAVPIVAGTPALDRVWGGPITKALAAAPKPQGLETAFALSQGRLKLAVAGAPVAGGNLGGAYFYPYDDQLLDQAAPQRIDLGPRGLTLSLKAGAAFRAATPPPAAAGVLVADGRAYEISALPGPLPTGAGGLGPPRAGPTIELGLPLAMGFALIGGLLLNLMPCVFPVLAMKAAALAGHGGSAGRARAEGLAFLGGVMASFLLLAGVMIAARQAGAALGWGFQLQSPLVVSLLCLVMLAAALNLSGLFEVGAGVQGIGGHLGRTGGVAGAFLTGVLAVTVAAPCTAPFMGPALGWALTTSASEALAVFAMLALGFALPFVALAFAPALQRRLPRPGRWMEVFRRLLALPMYGAAAWLAWVVSVQTGTAGLARLSGAVVALSFAAWLWGVIQRRRARGEANASILAVAVAGLIAAAGLAAAAGRVPPPYHRDTAAEVGGASSLDAEAFTPERLAALRAQGRPVLVNFTAAWCVTCQVNERAVFANGAVASAFRQAGASYLVADWTNRDPAIAKALADQGRIGVPLYLVYGGDGGSPRILPQLLTPSMVTAAIQAAAGPRPASS